MNTTFKKWISLLLSLILVLSIAPCALAEGEESDAEEDTGLIDADELNAWMDNYLKEHRLTEKWMDFSVGFCYTGTGDCWFYHGDAFMYSASLYKVPVSMLMAEKEAAGELSPDSLVEGYTLQYLESSALTYSNNTSGHAMVDYLGGTYHGKCTDMMIPYTDLNEDYFVKDFYDHSYYTARFMTQIMKTLYEGGEERFPHVIEYLLPAQPDSYLNLSLKGVYTLAQKYGSYTEKNGNANNHIAAIVYTPTPVIIVIMTRNVGDYQKRMAEVGEFLAAYSLTLDEKKAELERNPPPTPTPEQEQPTPDAEQTPDLTQVPAQQVTEEEKEKSPLAAILIGAAALIALAALAYFLVIPAVKRRNLVGEGTSSSRGGYRPRH